MEPIDIPAFLAIADMVKSNSDVSSIQQAAALRILQRCCSGQCLGAGGMLVHLFELYSNVIILSFGAFCQLNNFMVHIEVKAMTGIPLIAFCNFLGVYTVAAEHRL
jgi:hypothetical protein